MQLIRNAADFQTGGRKVCIGIGVFDGVHLGHQQVLRQTIYDARQHNALSLAITFDRHPATVVAPAFAPRLIYSLPRKLREIENLGLDGTLLIEFTRPFSEQTGEEFIRALVHDLGEIHSICVGSNFNFGHKRSGNVDLLCQLGSEIGFKVHGLAAVSLGGKVVSSTRIRQSIAEGNLDAASQMLGRTYSIAGKVIRGDQLGRKLGFPTANIEISGLITPPNGVYAVRAKLGSTVHPAVANIGVRPTVRAGGSELRLEVHIPHFSGDLYDQEPEISFVRFIRPEMKFENLDQLQAQIRRDIQAASEFLN